MNDTIEKRNRAKRADLEAMQARLDSIIFVMAGWTEAGGDLPKASAEVVYRIARGDTLESLIMAAGKTALGLGS